MGNMKNSEKKYNKIILNFKYNELRKNQIKIK